MKERPHYPNLETLRGLAALMVAVGHSFIALPFDGIDYLWNRPVWSVPVESTSAFITRLFLVVANGQAGVTIFFVLSGVVLGLSLDADKRRLPGRYGDFLVKRLLRIYPAHVVSMLVICALLIVVGIRNRGAFDTFSSWYNWYYRTQPDAATIISNLSLLKTSLNPVTWTLFTEVAVAFIFPILHLVSRVKIKWAPVLQASLLFLLVLLSIENSNEGIVLPHIYKFYLGLLIPVYGSSLASFINRRNLTLPVSFVLLLSVTAILIERSLVSESYRGYGIISSLGAALLIYTIMQHSGGWLFRLQALRQLGQYSYSFYLWHFPILWFTYYALYSAEFSRELLFDHTFIMAGIVCMVTVIMAYTIASVSYWGIEHRMIIWGRHLIGKQREKPYSGF